MLKTRIVPQTSCVIFIGQFMKLQRRIFNYLLGFVNSKRFLNHMFTVLPGFHQAAYMHFLVLKTSKMSLKHSLTQPLSTLARPSTLLIQLFLHLHAAPQLQGFNAVLCFVLLSGIQLWCLLHWRISILQVWMQSVLYAHELALGLNPSLFYILHWLIFHFSGTLVKSSQHS